jgi:hypothetical protein
MATIAWLQDVASAYWAHLDGGFGIAGEFRDQGAFREAAFVHSEVRGTIREALLDTRMSCRRAARRKRVHVEPGIFDPGCRPCEKGCVFVHSPWWVEKCARPTADGDAIASIFDDYEKERADARGRARVRQSGTPTRNQRSATGDVGYRLGDVFRYNRRTYNATLRRYHPGTVGAEYASRTRAASDLPVLSAVAANHCRGRAPPPGTAVHLRLGDALCDSRPAAEARRPLPAKAAVDAIRRAVAPGDNTTVYYGVHHDVRAAADCTAATHAYAREVAGALRATLVAGDTATADRDFCDMVAATTFVQGRGGYSQLIADLRAERGESTVVAPELAATEYGVTKRKRRPSRVRDTRQ